MVEGTVETTDTAGVLRNHRETISPRVYLQPTHATQPNRPLIELKDAALAGRRDGGDLERAHRLSAAVADAIAYVTGATGAETTAAEALELGKGVCQDQAHALIALAHAAGPAGALRHRLSSDRRADRGRRGGARLGRDPCRGPRLGRLRPGQPLLPGRALHPRSARAATPARRRRSAGVSRGGGVEAMDVTSSSRRSSRPGSAERPRMTYCVGLLLEAGIVMLSDTRTNAGLRQHRVLPQDVRLRGARRAGDRAADRGQPVGHPDGDRQAAARDRPRRSGPETSIMHGRVDARGGRDRRADAERRQRRDRRARCRR